MGRFMSIVLLTSALTGTAIASQVDTERVERWAACFASVESIELVWDWEAPTIRTDGKSIDKMRTDVFLRARWPDGLDAQYGRGRASTDAPRTQDGEFTERIVFKPGGDMLEFSGQGSRKSVERRHGSLDHRTSAAVWKELGPLFSGKWMHDVGFPAKLAKVSAGENGAFVIDVPSMKVRAVLSPYSGPGCSDLVLSQVQVLGQKGNVQAQYDYSDFRPAENTKIAIGFRRRTTLSVELVDISPDLPKTPRERQDVLVKARVIPRLGADTFDVSTEGFKEQTRPDPKAVPDPNDPRVKDQEKWLRPK